MGKELIKIDTPELALMGESKALKIKETFEPMAEMLLSFEEAYDSVIAEAQKEINDDVATRAKRLRLDIGKVRIETDKARKEQKDEYLRAGKAIDGVCNILKWAVIEKEEKLKEIENYLEEEKKKELARIQIERADKLSPYVADASDRNLVDMCEDVWVTYFNGKKREYEDRVEAEKSARLQREEKEKADIAERERKEKADFLMMEKIKKENKKLKKEVDTKAAKDKKTAAERDALNAKLEKEREVREKLEKELKEREEAEKKRITDVEIATQAGLSRNDNGKVVNLIAELHCLKAKYVFRSKKNQALWVRVQKGIDNIIEHIEGV